MAAVTSRENTLYIPSRYLMTEIKSNFYSNSFTVQIQNEFVDI